MTNLPAALSELSDLALLTFQVENKDDRSRLSQFSGWLAERNQRWYQIDLVAYRDDLIARGLQATTIACHLASIRSRYRDLLLNRDLFFEIVMGLDGRTFEQAIPVVNELIARIEAAIAPRSARVSVTVHQDKPDGRQWMTSEQARLLLTRPDDTTLTGKRDRAILGLLLGMGLREAELADLVVGDLFAAQNNVPALLVRHGKRNKSRLVPWGRQLWVRNVLIAGWLKEAGITDGPVFRGITRWGEVQSDPISTRTVIRVVSAYPVPVKLPTPHLMVIRPHDCRRFYARSLYEAGVPVTAIRDNMGHETVDETWPYIGPADFGDRIAPNIL